MYRNHTVGVVVPAYNEAQFVGTVIETVPSYVDRVYVVDDGSTDDTWAVIRSAAEGVEDGKDRPVEGPDFERRVVPIRHEENRGVGAAITTGYRWAREDRIAVTAVMGGDGQMRPGHLASLLDPIVEGRAEYTKGNRLLDTETREGMPTFRFLGNHLLSWLTKVASGYWAIGDPQNGYTAISLSALDALDLDDVYEFYGYCNDLLVKLNVHGFRVVDVPRACNYADEESHIEYRSYVPRVAAMLFGNFLWRLRAQYLHRSLHPAAIGYLTGMATGTTGVLLAIREGVEEGVTSRGAVNAVLTALVGVVPFVLGAVFERRRHADRSGVDDDVTIGGAGVSRGSHIDGTVEPASSVDRDRRPRDGAVEADGEAPLD